MSTFLSSVLLLFSLHSESLEPFMPGISIKQQDYEYHCIGDCNTPSAAKPHPGVVLMGGNQNVDDAFKQLIAWSDYGNFLIIRADTVYDYNPYIYSLAEGRCQSVASLIINNQNGANSDFALEIIHNADAIFISGGNTTKYLHDWPDSILQSAIQEAIEHRNIPIGGTSAGSILLSWYIYKFADDAAVSSKQALMNPYNERMQFNDYFVRQKDNILHHVIIDAHFKRRDRMGILIAFIARMRTDRKNNKIKGIGIMENTAIAIDLSTKIGTVMGNGSVYILTTKHDPSECEPSKPVTYKNINVQKLNINDRYDFALWGNQANVLNYKINVINGSIITKDIYLEIELKRYLSREMVHRLVMYVMLLCVVVIGVSVIVYFLHKEQIIIQRLKTETKHNDKSQHLMDEL